MSPVPGFHAAALAYSITLISTYIALWISRRGTARGINEDEEVMAVHREGRVSTGVVVSLKAIAATAGVITAAALG